MKKIYLFTLLLIPILVPKKATIEEVKPITKDIVIFDMETKKIADTIAWVETKNNDNAKGGSGERGKYQTMPSTYRALTKKYYGEVKAFSTTTQEFVVFKEIEQLRLKNIQPKDIFKYWNTGSLTRPCSRGVNKYNQFYDSCSYIKKSLEFYNNIK